jgi:hypothetical protein
VGRPIFKTTDAREFSSACTGYRLSAIGVVGEFV